MLLVAALGLGDCTIDGVALALSDPARRDVVTVSGEFAGPGVICPQFRLDSGETISLSGDVPQHSRGERRVLRGSWRPISKCMQGREFRVLPDSQ